MKPGDELQLIDKEADDVLERMMDDRTAKDMVLLKGHTGPVYATSFNQDRNFMVSASEDGTGTYTTCSQTYQGMDFLLMLRLLKLPSRCYSNVPGILGNLGSSKEILLKLITCKAWRLEYVWETVACRDLYVINMLFSA